MQKYGAQYGLSPQMLLDVIAFETGGTFDPDSKNNSGAAGLFQIMPGTWIGLARHYEGTIDFTDPLDVDQNVHAGAINLASAIEELNNQGISDPTEEQIYLAQNQGGAGAAALINNPNINVVDALKTVPYYWNHPLKASLAIQENGGSINMTSAQFVAYLTGRFRAFASRTPKIN